MAFMLCVRATLKPINILQMGRNTYYKDGIKEVPDASCCTVTTAGTVMCNKIELQFGG